MEFKEYSYIEKWSLEVLLLERYRSKSGIATLKNKVYIFKPIKEDKKYYYKDKNHPIEKEVCRNISLTVIS